MQLLQGFLNLLTQVNMQMQVENVGLCKRYIKLL